MATMVVWKNSGLPGLYAKIVRLNDSTLSRSNLNESLTLIRPEFSFMSLARTNPTWVFIGEFSSILNSYWSLSNSGRLSFSSTMFTTTLALDLNTPSHALTTNSYCCRVS
ncbi:hypothetical protein BpHYR1_008165 [Brachionus plicatilis]|uniref:Uncharacterized protein n=1 Tax=Brachionus plicatilis TaxID=10195 RepID=A0A3M7PRI5_BRAPC|nr:hypothetical protein BpHYR1_008165 [Brachionus plicatilis]